MRGQGIVAEVMSELRLGKEDFFRSKFPEHVRARRIAIKRLDKAGLNRSEIGRVMQIDQTTVGYWLSHEVRKRKNERRRRYWHEIECGRHRTHPLLTDDFRLTVQG